MKILFSPCHFLFDEIKSGSEFSWAFNIGNRVSMLYPESVVITGSRNLIQEVNYKIIEVQPERKVRNPGLTGAVSFNLRNFQAARRQIASKNFDVLHHTLPFAIGKTFNIAWLLKSTKNTPKVLGPIQNPLEFKDSDIHAKSNSLVSLLKPRVTNFIVLISSFPLSLLSDKTLSKADKVIVVNPKAKSLILKKGVSEEKIVIIPPGVDTSVFRPKKNVYTNTEKIKLLSASLLIKRKGIELILNALAEIVKEEKNVSLTILGDGPQKETLQELTERLGLQKFVVFKGYVPNSEIQKYYQASDIFVNMSRSEAFATVCLEAMSSGLVVVSSKVGGFEDAISEGRDGFLVNQGDYKSLAKIILFLTKNRKCIGAIGSNARKNIENNYDWNNVIIPKYLKVYREVQHDGKA